MIPPLRSLPMVRCLLALALVLGLLGCSSIGPATVGRDRLDYAAALADASKRETLLNIVKLRYADAPSLVTVSQLVAGYTLEGRVDLRSNFFTDTFDLSDDVSFGVGGTFSDRPTATYTPIRGDDFARLMLTPIPPSELFAMLATGGPAALTLGLGVQSINGLRNWSPDTSGIGRVDAAFVEVLQLIGSCVPTASWAFASSPSPAAAPPICWSPTMSVGRSMPGRRVCSICSGWTRARTPSRSGSASVPARPARSRSTRVLSWRS